MNELFVKPVRLLGHNFRSFISNEKEDIKSRAKIKSEKRFLEQLRNHVFLFTGVLIIFMLK